jgi:hypothetical protein
MLESSGRIDNIFSQDELIYLIKYFANLPKSVVTYDNNSFAGISQAHPLYLWFCKNMFDKIQQLTKDNIQLLFGSYLYENNPWTVHCDYYHKSVGSPYKAFLVPISVDEDMSLVEKTNTIIFNEEDVYVDTSATNKMWDSMSWNATKTKKENNAMSVQDQHLSHISVDDLECLTIQNILNWKLGSVVYWDEKLLHSSDNFRKNNINSKQAIVIHTYVV